MELCKDGGNMITWFGVRDETSKRHSVLVAVVEGSTEEVPRAQHCSSRGDSVSVR